MATVAVAGQRTFSSHLDKLIAASAFGIFLFVVYVSVAPNPPSEFPILRFFFLGAALMTIGILEWSRSEWDARLSLMAPIPVVALFFVAKKLYGVNLGIAVLATMIWCAVEAWNINRKSRPDDKEADERLNHLVTRLCRAALALAPFATMVLAVKKTDPGHWVHVTADTQVMAWIEAAVYLAFIVTAIRLARTTSIQMLCAIVILPLFAVKGWLKHARGIPLDGAGVLLLLVPALPLMAYGLKIRKNLLQERAKQV